SLEPLLGRGLVGPPLLDESPGRTAEPARPPTDPPSPRVRGSLVTEDGHHRVRVVGEARYGEAWFELAVWDPARRTERDLVAEGRLATRLAELVATLPHGRRARTSLQVLADARHVAEIIVPTLRAEGWSFVLSEDFPHEAPIDVEWVERLEPRGDSGGWFALELGVIVAGRTVPLLPLLLGAIEAGHLSLAADGD